MTGQRVRILLEWYDPDATPEDAASFARLRAEELGRTHPGAVVAVYAETRPPADEVEGLRRSAMRQPHATPAALD